MMHYLLALVFCIFIALGAEEQDFQQSLSLSSPEQLASLNSEPDYLIGGLISPVGGHPVLRKTDLIVKGAQEIALTRIYTAPYIPSSFPKHDSDIVDALSGAFLLLNESSYDLEALMTLQCNTLILNELHIKF